MKILAQGHGRFFYVRTVEQYNNKTIYGWMYRSDLHLDLRTRLAFLLTGGPPDIRTLHGMVRFPMGPGEDYDAPPGPPPEDPTGKWKYEDNQWVRQKH